jgi:hypothetical protein
MKWINKSSISEAGSQYCSFHLESLLGTILGNSNGVSSCFSLLQTLAKLSIKHKL